MLGIDSKDVTSNALDLLESSELTYPHLGNAKGDYPDELGVTGFPESFLVDPQGKVALVRPGPVTETYLEDEVAPLIGAS